MPPDSDAPPGRRLHPAVLVIWPFSQIVPLAFLLLTDTLAAGVAGAALALTILAGLVRWWRFRWRLTEGALVVEQGLLSRQRRVIPFERIQTVDLVRKVRHRLFGVTEVRVEVVGGSGTEGRLDALTGADAERLRAALLVGRARAGGEADAGVRAGAQDGTGTGTGAGAGGAQEAAAGEELVALRPGQLVVAGLTGGRVGIAAALLGGAQELIGDRLDDVFEDLPRLFTPTGLIAVAVAVLVVSFLLSVAVTVVAYWDFRVTRQAGELRVRRGLLEQRLDTVPLRRIQALRIEENLLRRPFGLAAVKVDVAGKAGGGDARDSGLLLPLGGRAQARALVARLLEVPALAEAPLRPMPRAALRRRLVRAVAATALPTGVAVALVGPPGLLAALLGIPAVAAALDAYRALGHAEVDGVLVARSGVLVRRTAFVPVRSLQSLALTASPFQRRAGLATLELQIARSPRVWGGPRFLDVAAGDGEVALGHLATAATGGFG